MKLFLDSSALVKRYVEEIGSLKVGEICKKADEIAVSIICIIEVLSACNRLLREKKINSKQYNWIKSEFFLDIDELLLIDLNNDVIIRSILCLENGALRSLDALHIAAALEYKCDLFLSGDARQKKIASQMGLKVEII